MVYVILRALARCVFVLLCGLRLRRRPRRFPAGGFVVASNHQSYLDPILLGLVVTRPITFMARDTLFRNPLFAWLLRAVHTFPVRREGVGKEGMREALRHLKAGDPVVVFPEGTRSRDGEVGPIKDGAGLLSRLAGVPVVPAAVHTFRSWPRDRPFPLPARVSVAYGEPIPAARFREDPEGAREQLSQAIRSLYKSLNPLSEGA